MVSICSLNCFANPAFWLWLLALLCKMDCSISVSESAAPTVFKGKIHGNVTIHCPVNKQSELNFLYLQRGNIFVNGYHGIHDSSKLVVWENTRLDPTNKSVHIYGLNVSHDGSYQCHIQYAQTQNIETIAVRLIVTADFSKPTVTTSCSDKDADYSCRVTCASHGGYPLTKMTWDVHVSGNANQMWTVVNNSEVPDPVTAMYNSSSTAHFNCSGGELKSLSCSVGEVTSDLFTVCTPKKTMIHNVYVVIIAIICSVICSVMVSIVVLLQCKKHKKRHTGPSRNAGETFALTDAA